VIDDLTIDTNVWAHADNPFEPRQADAILLLRKLLASSTAVCVDPGFSLDEAANRSRIGSEYLTHLAKLPLAGAVLATLASTERVAFVDTNVPTPVRKCINRVIGDPSDRVFAKVAYNSQSHVLCSHDFTHMPEAARAELRDHAVTVEAADQVAPML
jgi:hypothetical protein